MKTAGYVVGTYLVVVSNPVGLTVLTVVTIAEIAGDIYMATNDIEYKSPSAEDQEVIDRIMTRQRDNTEYVPRVNLLQYPIR